MTTRPDGTHDERDLTLTRIIDAPPALVWKAWTTPEHVKKWWTPAPWTTPECEIDLRPGGGFRTLMRGPNGEEHDSTGAFLEVVENRRLVFTDALGPGYRPTGEPFMTAIITFEPAEGGTRQTALVLHKDAEARRKHEEMGFHEGWGKAAEQLAAVVRELKASR